MAKKDSTTGKKTTDEGKKQKLKRLTHDDFFQDEQVKRLIAELNGKRRNKRLLYLNEAPSKFYNVFCDAFYKATGQTEEYVLNVIQNEYNDVYVYNDRLLGEESYISVLGSAIEYTILKYFPDKLKSYLLTAYPNSYKDDEKFLEKGMALYRSTYEAVGRTFILDGKFWWIALLTGGSAVVTEGKVGTLGQSQQMYFGDEASAKKEVEKYIAAKLKKGYVEEVKTHL